MHCAISRIALKLIAKRPNSSLTLFKLNYITKILNLDFSKSCYTSPSVRNTLEKNGYIFEEGFTCVSLRCVSKMGEKYGIIYVNKVTGFFMCTKCQELGDWESINKNIKDSVIRCLQKDTKNSLLICEGNNKWNELSNMCRNILTFSKRDQKKIYTSFNLNDTNPNILKEMDVLVDEEQKNLYFPLYNFNKKVVGVKQVSQNNEEHCFPTEHCRGLLKYVSSKIKKDCDSAVVVKNIRDLITLASSKPNLHIICLPYGIEKLPQEVLPLLESYKKLIIWFGNDKYDLAASRMFSKQLGDKRCFLVRSKYESPSEYKKNNDFSKLHEIYHSALSMVHPNVISFSDLEKDLWNELTNVDEAQGVKWKRFPILNDILKGHRKGELTIMTGPTGCGKTTFLSEYSLDLIFQGVPTLWGSFEIRNQRLSATMLQQMFQSPLSENLDKYSIWAAEFKKLPVYFLNFHGQQPIEKVIETVEHFTLAHDIQHLIIDNLQFMMGIGIDDGHMDRFYKQDIIVAAFRTFATLFNCHVTLIIHPKKEKETEELAISSIFGSAKAAQEADNVMILQNKVLPSLQLKKYLQIVKNRYTGELGVMPLHFNKSSLSFAGKKAK